ncbi:MAG: phosphatase PAP2 family protein [Candidatus Magasanikbacteria bacterium]|nr:phosphatase PAP2 family protein [Candidatus Magasanikbacteria bacterium]
MRDYSRIIFDKINFWQGKNRWLDAIGRAGAEWVIVAMCGWFAAAAAIICWPDWRAAFAPLVTFAAAWAFAWCVSVGIGFFVDEPRPHVSEPESKQLFKPSMSWKSFPSDHSMSAFLLFFIALIFGLPGAWALFVLAVWVVFGRLYSGVHYPIDIIGGFFLAAAVAVWVKYLMLFL